MIGYRYRSRWGYDFCGEVNSLIDVLDYYIPNDYFCKPAWEDFLYEKGYEEEDLEEDEELRADLEAEYEDLPEYTDGGGNELDLWENEDGSGSCAWDGAYLSFGAKNIEDFDESEIAEFLADWNFGHCLDADDIAYLVELDPLRLRDIGECYDGDKEDEETEDCSALLQDDRFLREIYEKIALDGYEDDRISFFDKYARKHYEIEW